MNRRIAPTRSLTLAKVPRRMAWRVMIPKNTSTSEMLGWALMVNAVAMARHRTA